MNGTVLFWLYSIAAGLVGFFYVVTTGEHYGWLGILFWYFYYVTVMNLDSFCTNLIKMAAESE